MTLGEFNAQVPEKAREALFRCCGCTKWADSLIKNFPFTSIEDLKILSDKTWFTCSESDWREAFSHHPKIGEKKIVNDKHTATKEWAQAEQSGVKDTDKKIIDELAKLNRDYEARMGFIFIVFASGKSGSEMLSILKERLNNDFEKELHIAAGEQNKITHNRIDKLLS